jgi:hypothetical protein
MAAQRQPKKWPPRSLPRPQATGALSRSNTSPYPANDGRRASQTVEQQPPSALRIECCCPPAPSIWCAATLLITISMPSLRHFCVKEGSSARFRGEESDFVARSPQPRRRGLPLHQPSGEPQQRHRAVFVGAQSKVKCQTTDHRPRDKSNMTIKDASVTTQGCAAGSTGDRVRSV